jgi:hypothetical protein
MSGLLATSTCTTGSTCGPQAGASKATGDMIIVRYADDIIVGFRHERCWSKAGSPSTDLTASVAGSRAR